MSWSAEVNKFKSQEDQYLKKLVHHIGTENWAAVSLEMGKKFGTKK